MFSRNIKEFPTMLHRDIYMTALRLTPPEVALESIEKTDPNLAKSGYQYNAFILELLADMYKNPYSYGFNPGAYERYFNYRKYNGVKRWEPLKAKELHDQSSAELFSYFGFLKDVALYSEVVNNKCILLIKDYENIKKQKLNNNTIHLMISNEHVVKMLERLGMHFNIDADKASIYNDRYPEMFNSASLLAKAVEESVRNPISKSLKYYFTYNWAHLDFRQITCNYKPVYNDYVHFLSDADLIIMRELQNIIKEYNMTETYNRPFIIEYNYKGKRVMTIWFSDYWLIEPNKKQNNWIRSIIVRFWGSSRIEYQLNIMKQGEDFISYFRKHLNYCGCCNPDHVVNKSGIRNFLGRNVRICADPGCIIKNPTVDDLQYIKKLIELQIEEIMAK